MASGLTVHVWSGYLNLPQELIKICPTINLVNIPYSASDTGKWKPKYKILVMSQT